MIISISEIANKIITNDFEVLKGEEWYAHCKNKVESSVDSLKDKLKGEESNKPNNILDGMDLSKVKDEITGAVNYFDLFNCIGNAYVNFYREEFTKKNDIEFWNLHKIHSERVLDEFFKKFNNEKDKIKALVKKLNDRCNEEFELIYDYYTFLRDNNVKLCNTLNIARMLVFFCQIYSTIYALRTAYALEIRGADKNRVRKCSKGDVLVPILGFLHFNDPSLYPSEKLYFYRKEYSVNFKIPQDNVALDELWEVYCKRINVLKEMVQSLPSRCNDTAVPK